MLLRYGPYSFPLGQVEVLPRMQTQRDESGRPLYYHWDINIRGMMVRDPSISDANGSVNLTNYDQALRALTSLIGKDLVLYDTLGRPTSINFRNTTSCVSPMQVTSLSYPDGGGGEYVTKRSFDETFTATYAADGRAGSLTAYHETVTVSGTGGPLLVWQPSINGPPIPCMVYPETTIRVIVAGNATGFERYPSIPRGPLPSAFLINPATTFSQQAPKFFGNHLGGFREFPVSWQYVYEGRVGDLRPNNLVARAWPLGQ